jgi:hypothetical protein
MGQFTQANVQAQETFDPYLSSGSASMQQLMGQMGMGDPNTPLVDVTTTPGYQQSMQQALGAVNQGAAGSGMLMSGERLKSLATAGQSVFGDYYQNYMNRLQGMAGQGFNAANSMENTRTNNLNLVLQKQALAKGGGGGASPVGDMMGAAASMFGTYMGS